MPPWEGPAHTSMERERRWRTQWLQGGVAAHHPQSGVWGGMGHPECLGRVRRGQQGLGLSGRASHVPRPLQPLRCGPVAQALTRLPGRPPAQQWWQQLPNEFLLSHGAAPRPHPGLRPGVGTGRPLSREAHTGFARYVAPHVFTVCCQSMAHSWRVDKCTLGQGPVRMGKERGH